MNLPDLIVPFTEFPVILSFPFSSFQSLSLQILKNRIHFFFIKRAIKFNLIVEVFVPVGRKGKGKGKARG
ncbi:hypothetical protein GCM10008086_00590 [Salegentibacter mishustinae]|nr:hypothetical protein GCM10008086_00590 [Salegentibacter mishustinae]